LTGVGERSHLPTPQVNLDTHIDDIVNLIEREELTDVIPCCHSYGGCVISGAADRLADRIGALVYLGAFVLQDVNLSDREWVDRQCTMQSIAIFQQPIKLRGRLAKQWRSNSP
jgi:pimeloyl-ACP methyl ester carboxylesterase